MAESLGRLQQAGADAAPSRAAPGQAHGQVAWRRPPAPSVGVNTPP